MTNTPCDQMSGWKGVSCSDGHVTKLNLSKNNLCGDIPLSLINLSEINSIDLQNNHLTASDPKLMTWLKAKDSAWVENQTECGIELTDDADKSDDANKLSTTTLITIGSAAIAIIGLAFLFLL